MTTATKNSSKASSTASKNQKAAPNFSLRTRLTNAFVEAEQTFKKKVVDAFLPAAEKAASKATRHVVFVMTGIDADQSVTVVDILKKEQMEEVSSREVKGGFEFSLMIPNKKPIKRNRPKASDLPVSSAPASEASAEV